MFRILNVITAVVVYTSGLAQGSTTVAPYKGVIVRPDGQEIVFDMELQRLKGKPVLYIVNGRERIKAVDVRISADSVLFKMPVFESEFKAAVNKKGWQGTWQKEIATGTRDMEFYARPAAKKFGLDNGAAAHNVSGRWRAEFASDSTTQVNAVAEFAQNGSTITGSFLTTTGDYRYLSGVVTGNQLKLSTFDGSHAFLFTATIVNGQQIKNGRFYSGLSFVDEWTAAKDPNASIPAEASAMYLKRGEKSLDFAFPDLDSNIVSIQDSRFKNKVVVVQIMGSWCPNCMDETAFLSEYYKANKARGVEVLGLAYEYGTNFEKGKQGLQKFKDRFNVTYPFLFTGVSVADSLRTEKTLPQVTPIKVFPSSIIIDKKGVVRKLDNGFYGPGTGIHYTKYKQEFAQFIDMLLAE